MTVAHCALLKVGSIVLMPLLFAPHFVGTGPLKRLKHVMTETKTARMDVTLTAIWKLGGSVKDNHPNVRLSVGME